MVSAESIDRCETSGDLKLFNPEKGSYSGAMPKSKLLKQTEKPEFHVKLYFMQNTSWQGEILWINTGKKIRFRSMLELIMIMQEAMEISGEPQMEYSFRSWGEQKEEAYLGCE